ncbi:uroporphyrinogen decarboxylase [Flavobacteriaceae bacterium Ap0902]|nr:uroporphyrinogen decarboxylase [Flavobacteriaceae bacterium Ap0902]
MLQDYTEYIGYAASAGIIISFLIPNNIRLLRAVNGVGCALFALYGFLIDSWPVIIPNTFIFLIQIYYLFIHKPKD